MSVMNQSARLVRVSLLLFLTLGVAATSPLAISAEIEEITVTARGIKESVRNIPVAITVMDETLLKNLNISTFEEVSNATPSLNIYRASSGNGAAIYIRGIGPSTTSIGIEQSVAVILDGVYFPQGRVINEGLFDVNQVAILKGPQALYFGKNATAGVMSIQTNNPGDEFEVMASIGYESEESLTTGELIVSGPLTDAIGARLALRGTRSEGYMENTAGPTQYTTTDAATFAQTVHDNGAPRSSDWPDEESFYGRLTMTFDATENLSFNLKASYSELEMSSTNGNQELWACPTLNGQAHLNVAGAPAPNLLAECRSDYARGSNPVPPTIAATNPLLSEFGGELGEYYESYAITVTAELELANADITAIVNYHDQETDWVSDFDGGGATATFAGENNTFDNFSAEVRAASRLDGQVNFVGGIYYQQTNRAFVQDVIFAGAENSAVTNPVNKFTAYTKDSGTDGDTISVYGELIWNFAERWEFTVGVRWLEETKDSYFVQPYVNPFFLGLFTEGVRVSADQQFNETIPEVTLLWEATDNMTVFAAYKEGFKSGGFSNSGILGNLSGTIEDFIFDPEVVDGFEAGIKGNLFDNSLTYEFEVYFYEFEDLQIDFFNSPQFAFITTNAGATETKGAELQLRWAPPIVEGLMLSGGLAFTKADYKDFIAPCYAGQTPATGCNIFEPGKVPQQQLGGTDRGLAPEWSGFVGLDYERGIGNGLTLGLTLNLQFKDDFLLGSFGHPSNMQDGYSTIDAAVRLRGGTDHRWQLALIGRNLTDEYALMTSGDNPGSGGGTGTDGGWLADQAGTVIRPLTLEIQATYWFGG